MAEDEQKEKNNSELTKLPEIDITPLLLQIHINSFYEQLKQIESELHSICQLLNNISQQLSDIDGKISAQLSDITKDQPDEIFPQLSDITKDWCEDIFSQFKDIPKDWREDIFSQLRDITKDWRDDIFSQLRDITKDWRDDIFSPFRNITNDWYYFEPYRSIGERNWVIPLTKGNLPINLLESENFDETVAELYLQNNFEMFKWTIDEIINNLTYDSQKQMVEDAKSSFNNKNYSACCYTLAPLIEAALVDMKNPAKTNLDKLFDSYCSAGLYSFPPVGYSISILSSLCGFIDNYCKSSNFSSGSEPEYINRHWMLHGRTHKIITKIECLQLIGALWAILDISKNINWNYTNKNMEFVKKFRSRLNR